ncbi:TPR repeat protein [Thiogranum longum]|uniref:TPR repeat protein n=1 Tax=Thiogranum longum TaxID=1537524 RepID=A0A4R1H871_9GAMM|nr:tetratricopeptide repeat protein [Thiogranum longum]TCK18034.1 TPR repeat protein [Thiogranum longum]
MASGSGVTYIRLLIILAFSGIFAVPASNARVWDELFKEQMESAEAGDPDAQYEVAIMYLNGRGVEQDFDATLLWLERAAENGSEQAASKLRRIKSQKKKFTATLKRAESGDSKAQYDIGMMYLKGRGVKLDPDEGRKWLEKSAAQSNEKAKARLAILLIKGDGGSKDYKRARDLLDSISETSALAQYYLGELYASGKGVPRNYETAMNWYQKAGDNGFSMAGGKVINMQEEIRMQARRKKNASKAAAEAQRASVESAQRRQARADAIKKAKTVKAAKAKKAPKKTVAKVSPKVVKAPVRLTPLQKLSRIKWSARNKPVEYLPSAVSECELEGDVLVCFSDELKRESGNQTVLYKVKSEVRKSKGGFSISYSNLVLGVEDMDVPDDEDSAGYDDEEDRGFAIQTGWTRAHQVDCQMNGKKTMNCVKDKTHRVQVDGDVKVAITDKK